MMYYIKLYFQLQAANIRSHSQYTFNFFVGILGVASVGIGNFLLIWVLTSKVPTIQGWNFYELVFLTAMFQTSHGIFIITFQQIRRLEIFIREGQFDRYLVRPLNPMFSYATSTVTVAGFGDLISGAFGLIYACSHLLNWEGQKIFYVIFLVISGAIIQWSLYTIIGVIGFWTLQGEGLRTILNAFLFQFNQFPLTVYNRGLQFILTFILGISFISYYPSALFFGKEASVPYSEMLVYLSPIIALLLALLTYQFWKRGINAYKGAGS